MARYNTTLGTSTTGTSTTIATPAQGTITTITTGGITVTVPSPVNYQGTTQTFYNSAASAVTLSTPAGVFNGPSGAAAITYSLPGGSVVTLATDGANYIIISEAGGQTVTDTLTVNNTATFASGAAVTFNASQNRVSSNHTIGGSNYDLISLLYLQTNYGQAWTVVSSASNLTAGQRVFANTSGGGFTLTLPASPNVGDRVEIIDYAGTFNTQTLTVGNNGNKIMRILDVMNVTTKGAAFTLVWSGSTNGWLMANGI